jgi:hypothetical protein
MSKKIWANVVFNYTVQQDKTINVAFLWRKFKVHLTRRLHASMREKWASEQKEQVLADL